MRHLTPTVLGLAIVATAALTGCESSTHTIVMQDNGVPYHERQGQDWWNHQFVYHPNTQSYYEPYSETHFWFEDGAWHAGPALPNELKPRTDLGQVVKLQSDDLPFAQHGTVLVWEPVRRVPMAPGSMDPQQYPLMYGEMLATEPTD